MKKDYNYTCQLCNKQIEDEPHKLNVHHIIPRREGGSSDKSNLIVLCTSCHTVIERLTSIGYNQGNGFSPQKLIEDIKKVLYK
jgi:predicted restriction endonuclease